MQLSILYSQAANENKNDNYEKALSHHKKAQYLNAGGFLIVVGGGFVFLMVVAIGGAVVGAVFSPNST